MGLQYVGAILANKGEDGTLTLWLMPTELYSNINVTKGQ